MRRDPASEVVSQACRLASPVSDVWYGAQDPASAISSNRRHWHARRLTPNAVPSRNDI